MNQADSTAPCTSLIALIALIAPPATTATYCCCLQAMQDVRQLAAKLFVGGGERLGHDIFSLEVRRWAPEAGARAGVATVAGADPTLMQMVQLAGLLGDEQTMAERTTEYLCSGGCSAVGMAAGAGWRPHRFRFAKLANGSAGAILARPGGLKLLRVPLPPPPLHCHCHCHLCCGLHCHCLVLQTRCER